MTMQLRESAFDEKIKWVGPAHEDRITNRDTSNPIETVYFYLEFTLENGGIPQGELLISAHSRYKLYINGELVTFGPCKSDAFRRYYERLDISKQIRSGRNQIVAKVVSFPVSECEKDGHTGPYWSHNKACGCLLLASGTIQDGERSVSLGTGIADWRYCVSDEITPVKDNIAFWLGYKEDVDGAKAAKTQEKERKPAISLFSAGTSVYGELPLFPLYERTIPLLYLKEKNFLPTDLEQDGTRILPHCKNVFRLDAGAYTTAYPRIRLLGGKGSIVTIRYAEAYLQEEDGQLIKKQRDDAGGVIAGHEDCYRPTDGMQTYEPFWFRTFRYIEITVATADNALTLFQPSFVETGYPIQALTQLGNENEEWVKKLWDISYRTLQRCMHETYEDCPYYEQLQYTMDTRLQMLFTYALSGDTRLAQKTIHEYHASKLPNGMLQSRYPSNNQQVIPVFSLHWIFMLQDYYQQTGDKDFIRGYMGTVDQVLHYFRSCKKEGLVVDLGYWEFIDWTPEWNDTHGVPHAHQKGPVTAQNLQYIYALLVACDLLTSIGFGDVAAAYQAEADAMKQLILDRCWDGHLVQEGPGLQDEYSQHTQLWAVLCKLGTTDMRRHLLQNILSNQQLIRCCFPTMFYVFRALEQEGLYDQTESVWDAWKYLLPLGLTTIPEISFGNPRSDCHAWGAALLYEFPRLILGVQTQQPNRSEILVEPKGFYIQRAEGTVCVPNGCIHVKRTVKDKKLIVEITPDCTQTVKLQLPDGTAHRVENQKTSVFTANL